MEFIGNVTSEYREYHELIKSGKYLWQAERTARGLDASSDAMKAVDIGTNMGDMSHNITEVGGAQGATKGAQKCLQSRR
jgi:hypothetical protein